MSARAHRPWYASALELLAVGVVVVGVNMATANDPSLDDGLRGSGSAVLAVFMKDLFEARRRRKDDEEEHDA